MAHNYELQSRLKMLIQCGISANFQDISKRISYRFLIFALGIFKCLFGMAVYEINSHCLRVSNV